MTLSPTLTPSDTWTDSLSAGVEDHSSRYPEEPQGLLSSTPNWSATPGSPASLKSPRLSSFASGWSRSSTSGPPSPKNSARSSAGWSKTPSGGSNQRSSCRTAVSGSPRIPVPVAHMSAFAWEQELVDATLVRRPGDNLGWLDELITRNPPMLPKLNTKRALFVLTKIDEILAWERRSEAERDTRFVELGRYLCEVRAGQYWRLENLKSFDEFLERRFPESRRKAYYLMSIHEHLPPQARKDLKEVGWTKGLELAKVARAEGQHFDCATWLHKAREMPKEEFKREVEKELTGRETEPHEIIYFKIYKSQIPVIEQAIETAALMLGTDKSRGYCLEMICADFLAGAHLEEGNPEILLQSIQILQVPSRRAEARIPGTVERAGFVSSIRPKRPRLRLDPESYKQLCRQVLRRDSWRCQACGARLNLEVHHRQHRSQSGDDSEQNLITLCAHVTGSA